MLSESTWDRLGGRRQLVADANAHFGYAIGVLIDESGFAKKGELSAGGPAVEQAPWQDRQRSGGRLCSGCTGGRGFDSGYRLGLYLPTARINDAARCDEAGAPKGVADVPHQGRDRAGAAWRRCVM